MKLEETYLRHLGLGRRPPNLEYLREIVAAQLARVPYENFSKLIRFKIEGASIPNFDEYIDQMIKRDFGGTCFAQNIHLNRLLGDVGFDSRMVAIAREGEVSHVSLRVRIGGDNYLVDTGIMSSVAGPFRINPKDAFDTQVGDQRFVFAPSEDRENYSLEIFRNGEMIRRFESSPERFTSRQLEEGIKKTFAPGATFMTTLVAHRAYANHSVGIWNRQLYRIEGANVIKRELKSFEELASAFRKDLALPKYPLREMLGLLKENGAEPLL